MAVTHQDRPKDGYLLRIFIGESDKYEGKSLCRWIVQQARAQGLAGATVLRGIIGFGAHSRIHTASIMRLSDDLPLVIEIVDSREDLEAFMRSIEPAMQEGLATMEKAEVWFYGSRSDD